MSLIFSLIFLFVLRSFDLRFRLGVIRPLDLIFKINLILIKCIFIFLVGTTCHICQRAFQRSYRKTFIVDVSDLEERVDHFGPAHIYLSQDVTKSKLRGPYRNYDFIKSLTEGEINADRSEAARLRHWVHQINEDNEHVFAYRYTVHNNSDQSCANISGVFVRDDKPWHQFGLELWFTSDGQLVSLFPSGPGYWGDQSRAYERITESWADDPSDKRCAAIQRSKFNFIMST